MTSRHELARPLGSQRRDLGSVPERECDYFHTTAHQWAAKASRSVLGVLVTHWRVIHMATMIQVPTGATFNGTAIVKAVAYPNGYRLTLADGRSVYVTTN